MTTKKRKLFILDNGHGVDTPGKRSPLWPDGSQLFEWEFNRDVVKRIASLLDLHGIEYEVLVPEDKNVSLAERCERVNTMCKGYKYHDCILISVHANAGGGTGWECYTTKGNTRSDLAAEILCEEFEKEFGKEWKMRFNKSPDGDKDKEENFYILKHTICPAVLTENFFMDRPKDCELIISGWGRERIAEAHVKAIQRMITEL